MDLIHASFLKYRILLVMVALYQDNLPIQTLAEKDRFLRTHEEVPEMINDIIWTDYGVPFLN
jgi:hypothetical protein